MTKIGLHKLTVLSIRITHKQLDFKKIKIHNLHPIPPQFMILKTKNIRNFSLN